MPLFFATHDPAPKRQIPGRWWAKSLRWRKQTPACAWRCRPVTSTSAATSATKHILHRPGAAGSEWPLLSVHHGPDGFAGDRPPLLCKRFRPGPGPGALALAVKPRSGPIDTLSHASHPAAASLLRRRGGRPFNSAAVPAWPGHQPSMSAPTTAELDRLRTFCRRRSSPEARRPAGRAGVRPPPCWPFRSMATCWRSLAAGVSAPG